MNFRTGYTAGSRDLVLVALRGQKKSCFWGGGSRNAGVKLILRLIPSPTKSFVYLQVCGNYPKGLRD